MPARKGSKKLVKKQRLLGQYQTNNKTIKVMESKVENQIEQIKNLENLYLKNDLKLKQFDQELESQEKVLLSQKEQINRIQNDIINARSQTVNMEEQKEEKYRIKITNRSVKRRVKNPSSHNLNLKAKSVRRNETYQVCQAIHGGSTDVTEPTLVGMVDTLASKFKADDLSKELLACKNSVKKSLQNTTLKTWTSNYTESKQNKLRSLNVYYSHDVMGKRKYMNVRKANKSATFEGHQVIQRLAGFYLNRNEERSDNLKVFKNIPKKCPDLFMFILALGGDGAPGTGTSVLVLF